MTSLLSRYPPNLKQNDQLIPEDVKRVGLTLALGRACMAYTDVSKSIFEIVTPIQKVD